MKRRILYIGIAVLAGLFAGYLIFGVLGSNDNASGQHDHMDVTESGQLWTCSMHPQIIQSESGDCPICGMDLIPVETDEDGLTGEQFKMTRNAVELANIQTIILGSSMENIENTIQLSGKIMQNQEANAVQASYFEGRIEKLNINYEGQEVRQGQLLATIYAPKLVAAQQELLTAASLKESQHELYDAVRNKLKLWKLTEDQIRGIESSGNVQENFPLYANISGIVLNKMIEEGDYVKQGQPLFKIADLSTVWAVFDVYENQISSLRKGQKIEIRTNAFPNEVFNGRISFINPVLNSSTRTVDVRVILNNRTEIFKPGMFVQGALETDQPDSSFVIMIPKSAVLWTGERSVVYIKANAKESIFEMREIVPGRVEGGMYEVLSGLNIGDEIVTNGAFTIDAAAQLKGKSSMMNKEGNKVMTGHEEHANR